MNLSVPDLLFSKDQGKRDKINICTIVSGLKQ